VTAFRFELVGSLREPTWTKLGEGERRLALLLLRSVEGD
jgi:hypothetical protein